MLRALLLLALDASARAETSASQDSCMTQQHSKDSVLLQSQKKLFKPSSAQGLYDDGEQTDDPLEGIGRLPPHLPLCDQRIVKETCVKLQMVHDTANPTTVSFSDLASVLSANHSDMADAWVALGMQPNQTEVACQHLCDAVVRYVEGVGGVLPPSSDIVCYTIKGVTACDVDVDPDKLVQKVAAASSDRGVHPDEGPVFTSREEDTGSRSIEFVTLDDSSRGLAAAPGVSGDPGAPAASEAEVDHTYCPYTVWEAVERIAGFFRMFPASGRDSLQVHSPEEPLMMQQSVSYERAALGSQSQIAYVSAQAKAWVATVLGEMNAWRTGSFRSKWFGGSGSLSEQSVRDRILRTLNFVQRELNQGIHWVFPADSAFSSVCKGALAYVWKGGGVDGQYWETDYPKCKPYDDPLRKNCALDTNGKYYVYLCRAMFEYPEDVQIVSFIHECVHHAGPKDVTYDANQMKGLYQSQQLDNAANYQNFAQDVAESKYGCKNDDSNCEFYKSQGYCNSVDNVKRLCQKACGFCQVPTARAPAPRPAPRPAPGPAPRPAPVPSGSCSDYDSNCALYKSLGYCDTVDNIKRQCQSTCGLCCTDTDSNCALYAGLGYCDNVANVQRVCKSTCRRC